MYFYIPNHIWYLIRHYEMSHSAYTHNINLLKDIIEP